MTRPEITVAIEEKVYYFAAVPLIFRIKLSGIYLLDDYAELIQ